MRKFSFRGVALALIGGAIGLATVAGQTHAAAPAQTSPFSGSTTKYLVYVGTYTNTGSKGIYAFRVDTATDEVEPLGLAAASEQPSFLAADSSSKYLYAVNETDTYQGQNTGAVRAFAINRANGKLTLLNEVPSRGASPAHITLDRTGKYLLVSNYNGGNLAVLPILADGRLGEATAVVQHSGASVNKDRQSGPHVHEIVMSPDNRFALSTDLGLDELFEYSFDASKGTLGASPRILKLTPGFGPRHLAFSPDGNFIYLVSEMGSTVSVLPYFAADGEMAVRQTVRLAPATDDPAKKWAAEIEVSPSEKFLYASNRGDDFIGVFSIDSASGLLTREFTIPVDGKTPRNFAIDPTGRWLWDANQDSDNLVLYRIDPGTGGLMPSGISFKVASPTCVLFIPVP